MGNLPDRSTILAMMTASTREDIRVLKDVRESITPAAMVALAGRVNSHWLADGTPGGANAAPGGTARNPTNATTGSVQQTNAAAGFQKYLVDIVYGQSTNNSIFNVFLYDRLADISGLSGTNTSPQNTTNLSVNRYTGTASAGNQIMVEVYTQIGATNTTITASYTNQAGTPGQTTIATNFGSTTYGRAITAAFFLPLAQGDTGVRSVESVTLAGTTGTAGDFGVTIIHPLAWMSSTSSGSLGVATDMMFKGPTPIAANACLAFYAIPVSNSNFPYSVAMKFGEF